MLFARFLGYDIDEVVLAMLIGASVTGGAYQIEKKLPSGRSAVLWKSLFIPSGFIVGYGLVYSNGFILAGAVIWTLILSYAFLHSPRSSSGGNKKVEELEKKMEQCC